MTGILKSGEVYFEPRARLLKLLGGELIRDDVMAIVELVKNAHDADASMVTLSFNATREGTGEILVEDDGDGMTRDDFLTGWMQPAGSQKRKKEFHYTRSGRRVLGEKGVGRFAMDRLGRYVQLISRGKGEKNEIVSRFDWDEFDDGDRPLSDIASTWSERRPEHFRNNTGTLLRIDGLRSRWTERNFRKLSSRLKRLISPFGNGRNFDVRIISDEFPDYSGALEISFLDRSPYRISAEFDGKNTIHYRLGDKDPFSMPWEGPGDLDCGPVKLALHCFDLESESVSRVGPRIDVKAWLREWSGVSIYRDGFRVLPYGEPDDDWLRLDQRRVNNPVVRLSNNQVCGFIEISGDGNPELRDQTNRGGLLANEAFKDLQALTLKVFRAVEAERQTVRNPKKAVNGENFELTGPGLFATESLLDLMKIDSTMDTKLRSVLEPRFKAIEKGVKEAERRTNAALESYLDLAGIGQTASFISQALQPHIRNLRTNLLTMLVKSLDEDDLDLERMPRHIKNMLDELDAAADIISRSSDKKKRLHTRMDLNREINLFEKTASHMLKRHGVSMSIMDGTNGIARVLIRPDSFTQVLHVLLSNALNSVRRTNKKKMIRISIERHGDDSCQLTFQDNGSGIGDDAVERIFEPGFTAQENSRGMGLTVARNLLRRVGGDIRLIRDRRRRGWTTFEITLRTKKPKLTSYDY